MRLTPLPSAGSIVLMLALVAARFPVRPAAAQSAATQSYDGVLDIAAPPSSTSAPGTLAPKGRHGLRGAIDLTAADARLTGTYDLRGHSDGQTFVLRGRNHTYGRLLWRGTVTADGFTGDVILRAPRTGPQPRLVLSGTLTFTGASAVGAGADLFALNCAGCHGPDATGLAGRPDIHCNRAIHDTVRNGRTGAIGVMPAFDNLSDPDIAAIQAFLDQLCPAASGNDLYASTCAACHGADARGSVGPDIHCNRSIHDTVRNGRVGPLGTMPAFPSLSDQDIATLQQFLDGLCTMPTGPELFASNCAACHGSDAAGTPGRPDIRCTVASRVFNAVRSGRGGGAMPVFSAVSLPDADVALINDFLSAACSGRPGDRFASNCATCHGATAGGGRNADGVRGPNIRCTEAGDFLEKVRFGDEQMPRFPELGTTEISGIAAFVLQNYCPLGG